MVDEISQLNREEILGINDLQIQEVIIPEWHTKVFVRGMTGEERDAFEASIIETRVKGQSVNMKNVRAKMAAYTVCDVSGNRIFRDADIPMIAKKNAAALQRIFAVAQKLSGLGEDDIEQFTKELKENPFESSSSG